MSVSEIYETMDYGTAPENAADALAWLVDQGSRFGHFIDGAFTDARDDFESSNPANGNVLATLTQASQAEVDTAVAAARKAQPKWAKLGGHGRARFLYALARLLQKHSRLFAVLETLDNGKPIREARDVDVPLAQRHFYYHAGMAQLMESELPDAEALGVCGQIIPWNFPLLMLAWKVAPALAMGNTVVLKPAEYTSLTALLFADICVQAGLPKGVVNIVTGDGAVGELIVQADVDKIAFTGSTPVGRHIREVTAGSGKALTLELGGKSPYIVFDDADLDSAVEGLVDAIWFNQGQVCCAGSRLLVHEPVADRFYAKLRARMAKLRVGDPLDKSVDVGALVDPVQVQRVTDMVAANTSGEVFTAGDIPATGCYYPPTLITGMNPADALMQDEIFGPVLVSTTFRTPAEAAFGPITEPTLDDIDDKVAVDYSARDADGTRRIYDPLRARVTLLGLEKTLALDMAIYPMVSRMQQIGMGADADEFERIAHKAELRMAEISGTIERAIGRVINPDSGDQVADLLFGELKLPPGHMTPAGKRFATDDKVLESLASEHAVVRMILDYRESSKIRGAFALKLIPLIDGGRIHGR
ncbi:hypothetical protein LCGC14_0361440, partial [marine sediment metagenome]